MTPQDIAALTAMVAIIKEIGAWPLISIVSMVILGPWLGMWWITRGHEKRHAEVVQMYQDNVQLVKDTARVADGLQSIVVLSTQVMTRVDDKIDNNLFCPLMRKDQKVEKQP